MAWRRASQRFVRGRHRFHREETWEAAIGQRWSIARLFPWALSLVLLFALLLVCKPWGTGYRETELRDADKTTLAHAKDLGQGITALLLEQYHANSWTRRHLRIDSTVTTEVVQEHLDSLGLRLYAAILVNTPEYIKGVPYGTVVLQPVSRGLRERWEPKVAELYETTTMLYWLAWEYATTMRSYGPMQQEVQQAYLKAWPKVARDVNERLDSLGITARLQENGYVAPERIIERCFEIDQSLEEHFGLTD